jgi:hypothetical protein
LYKDLAVYFPDWSKPQYTLSLPSAKVTSAN